MKIKRKTVGQMFKGKKIFKKRTASMRKKYPSTVMHWPVK